MLPRLVYISGVKCWITRTHPNDTFDIVILNEKGLPPTVWHNVPWDVFDVPELELEEAPKRGWQPRNRAAVTSNQERELAACRCEYWKS